MKGFDYLDRRRPKLQDHRAVNAKTPVKSHSEKGRIGSFFSTVLNGAGDFFKEDDEQ
jgi:hypothetical protein